MAPIWHRLKNTKEMAEMQALAAAYDGPVTRCPPGVARAHEEKFRYELPKKSDGSGAHLAELSMLKGPK